ncbi:MAG: hypothetical protein OEM02_07980, partial [Desulfobulbaceae bacterium]|nr:hypothetical protein [Desulfobulbaceae bacterium]
DAVMGDEPFASRLLAKDSVFFLANLAEPETAKTIAGSNFLHAAIETRGNMIKTNPVAVEKMVRMLKRSLHWVETHSAEEIADTIGVLDLEERESLVMALKKYPRAYSRDGKLSTAQLKETELFFHHGNQGDSSAQDLRLEEMVNDTWAGRKE